MPLSISGWRKGNKPVETPQEPVRQEPPAPPSAPVPLKAEEISAAVERLKKIRKQLLGSRAIEAYRIARNGLPHVVSEIEARALSVSRNRGKLLIGGNNPDQLIRGLGEERRRAEESVAKLKTAAVEELQKIRDEYSSKAGAVCPRAWKEWATFRRELLDFVGRYGDLSARLGLPVGQLAQEVENFNSEFNRAQLVIPGNGAAKPPVRVLKLGRGYSWNEFEKVIHAIQVWLR